MSFFAFFLSFFFSCLSLLSFLFLFFEFFAGGVGAELASCLLRSGSSLLRCCLRLRQVFRVRGFLYSRLMSSAGSEMSWATGMESSSARLLLFLQECLRERLLPVLRFPLRLLRHQLLLFWFFFGVFGFFCFFDDFFVFFFFSSSFFFFRSFFFDFFCVDAAGELEPGYLPISPARGGRRFFSLSSSAGRESGSGSSMYVWESFCFRKFTAEVFLCSPSMVFINFFAIFFLLLLGRSSFRSNTLSLCGCHAVHDFECESVIGCFFRFFRNVAEQVGDKKAPKVL